MNSIVVHVSSDFKMLSEEANTNGKIDSQSKVMNCIKSYSQGSFSNVESWVIGKAPNVTVRRYMKRSELQNIYAHRIEAARNWVRLADEALERRKVDMALQYCYWAYSLVRSLQHPYEAKDDKGRIMATVLPAKIRDILEKIDVKYESQEGEYVNLLFYYDGKPVSCLDFSYNDGQSLNEDCKAQDGRGCLEMAKGYEDTKAFYVGIEYEYKGMARGDAELLSVLNVVPKAVFKEASHIVKRENTVAKSDDSLKPTISQQPEKMEMYTDAMARIVDAVRTKQYTKVYDLFDIDGLDVFQKVVNYGVPRLIGNPSLSFFKGADGTVTVRGMQMSFSFSAPKRAIFTEDLVFTFNKDGKVCNVAFGLGKVAEQDILCRNVDWGDEVKEQIMEFMENYKTAYCLKRHGYISDIFADDAVIVVGRVTHRYGASTNIGEQKITKFGRDIITNNRYTKNQYLENLKKCFNNPRNKFINVKFAENDVQSLKSFNGHKVFGIQIKQLYNSATYGDVGYLFLMVDMTEPVKPQIKVRTWQPNETPMEQLFTAGDFYK